MSLSVHTCSLGKAYRDSWAVRELDLAVPTGTVYALLGPNGAGKSTILKLLTGLQRPTTGHGLCLGMDISTQGLEIRRRTGYMSEDNRMYGYMTVRQLLGFCRGFYEQWDDELAARYLDYFQILAAQKIHELSFGAKKQLALITAMAPRPELLLLDEPTSGFDPVKRRIFYNALMQETVAAGHTVLVATHQLSDVERLADQVGLLRNGRLVRSCSLDELKTKEKEIRVVFQKSPPSDLFLRPGIHEVIREGTAYRIMITDNLEEIWQAFTSVPHYALEMIDVDLEDIIMRYTAEGGETDD